MQSRTPDHHPLHAPPYTQLNKTCVYLIDNVLRCCMWPATLCQGYTASLDLHDGRCVSSTSILLQLKQCTRRVHNDL